MVGRHHQLNRHEFEQALGDDEEQGGLACYSPWGRKELDTTERLNNNNYYYYYFPGDTMVKNLPANAGDVGDVIRSLGQVICPRGGNGKPLQFSCLENLLDRVACLAPVHKVTKS